MSENLHHARFFWQSTAMLCILDFDGCFMEVNDAWEKKLGLSTSQLLSCPLLDFVHPEDQAATQYYLEQLQGGSVSNSFSCRMRHANGRYQQLLWEITAAASQSEAVYAVAIDISGRDQPSVADAIVSVLHEGVVLQYANGSIGACNASAERIIGLSAENMIGWTLVDPDWEMVRENGSPLPSDAHPAICALRTGEAFEDVIIGVLKPDGSEFWLRMNAHPLWRDDVTTPYAVVISFSDVTIYKETEKQLRRHGVQQSSVPDAPIAGDYLMWRWHLADDRIEFPTSWKNMLGYPESEAFEHRDDWYSRIMPEDYKQIVTDIQNHLEGVNSRIDNYHHLRHQNGQYIRTHCQAVAVYADDSGEPTHIIGMHVNADENSQSHTQENTVLYQQLLDTESDAVLLVEVAEGNIEEVNKGASQLYGYSRQELLTMKLLELSGQAEKMSNLNRRHGRQVEQRYHRRKDGAVFPVTVTVSPFVINERDMLMVVVKDNSARQTLETALWESQSKYRQLFEAASNPIIIFDTNTQHIFDVNGAAMELYGYTKEEWNNLTTAELSAEREQSRAKLTSGNKRAHIIPLRWHRKKDSTRFPVEISVGNSYLFQGRSLACATLRDMTERKASEEALRAERDFNQTLVQTSPAFFFAINEDGRIRMMNKAMLEALNYRAEEVMGQDFLQRFVPPLERKAVMAEFESLLQSMRPSIREWPVLDKNQQLFMVEWHSRAVLHADGSTDFLFGVGIDLTERRQAQNDRSLFKTIIDISEEAIAIRNVEGQMIYENPAHERLFGRVLRETGLYKEDLYPPESLEIIKRDIRPSLEKGENWSGEISILDADGHIVPVWQRTEAVRDEATGEILYEFELLHDISERQRMWETLRNQWEEYQLIFNNVPVMIWHRDKDNKLLRANKLATETFLPEDTEQAFYIDNLTVLQSGETRLSTIEIHSSILKESCWLQVGKAPYRNSEDELMGVIIFAVDITAYKKGQPDTEYVKLLLEQLPIVLNAFDRSGRLIAWNKTAELVSGYRASEVLKDSAALNMLYPNESDRRQMIVNVERRHWESDLIRKDGKTCRINWSNIAEHFPVRGWHTWQAGQPMLTGTGGNDALPTEVDNSSSELLSFVINATDLGLCVTDDRGRFVKMNPYYAELFGYTVEELNGLPFTTPLPAARHDDAVREYFSVLIGSGEADLLRETEEVSRTGEKFLLRSLLHRIVLRDGKRLILHICHKLPSGKK